MKDLAIIRKFIGVWPSKIDLIKWIKHWWQPKEQVDLQLGLKGFFTIVFHSIEDHNIVFESSPHFFGSMGLHMRYWTKNFCPTKEDFTHVPV